MKFLRLVFLLSGLIFFGWSVFEQKWIIEKHKAFSFQYTASDSKNKKEYIKLIGRGISSVENFFNSKYNKAFNVIIHPDRNSLDSAWRIAFKEPQFKSECWMVASGDAYKLDVISPAKWDALSCEHKYKNKTKTQQLITHELIHVYHGQLNNSPDFSNTDGIDWFVEGLATYASGQLDSSRIREVKQAISDQKIPKQLDQFWTGKIKYGLSGTVVMFIDQKFGREKLTSLLLFNKKNDLLASLNISEAELIELWKNYINQLKL